MRIVRVSYRVPPLPGGLERHVDMLTREQLARGHRVTLGFRHGEPIPGADMLTLAVTPRSRALAGRSDVLAFGAEVAHTLRRPEPADLVHLHGDYLDAAQIGPACRRLGVPLVLTVHGALNLRHRGLARWALRHVDAFVALGARPTADLLALGVEPEAILTTSSGVDLTAIGPPAAAVEPGLIVSVGALDPVKGHDTVIAAVDRLRATRPDAHLVIAGEGPLRDELARHSFVTLAGTLPRHEVYALLGRAEAFVLASRRLPGKGEGIPTAALEALACGTPVVLSTEATLDPVIAPSAYRTFPAGDAEALAAVLGTLPAGRDEHGPVAVQGRAWPRVAGEIEDWYGTAFRRCVRRGVFGHRLPARV
ncbi:glycosyltransferase family 4 protein [Dactylosporangium vinaceum]|uniref:Glycosyltransferase family 4 protein n=1 Tax=Dactylosporangium vinaceum TaxID=53362 RepID=A0ABV5MR86_9ACTN|nr:glycosyltransferase family 4 protein [Dactylosporangium vinaceum]UAC00529.1 glycosyltransferase family 4 protein [Dactylosporangium vinaceum]